MRRFIAAIAFIIASSSANAGWFGAYVWGGVINDGSVPAGVAQFQHSVGFLLSQGIDTIRFKIGPSQTVDYPFASDPCAGNQTLGCYARAMLASREFDDARLKRIIITTIDFTCENSDASGYNNGCVVASNLTTNANAIEAEYTDLYQALWDRFGSRIQVIIDNWEGDNFVYCADSYDFAQNTNGFATTCKSHFPSGQTNQQRAQAFLQWIGLKQTAATTFLAIHPAMQLAVAAEFNVYNTFNTYCATSGVCNAATDSVFANIKSSPLPWCSFSSYDAQTQTEGDFIAAVKDIETYCTHFFIGEAGYAVNTISVQTQFDLYTTLSKIKNQADGVVTWHAFDSPSNSGFGWWTADGTPQVINYLGLLRPTPYVSDPHR